MMKKDAAISKVRRFVNSISSKDVVAVMPDTDVDGISSGVLIFKALEKIKGKTPEIIQFQHVKNCITDDSLDYFRNRGVTKIIATDQAFDQTPEQILEAEGFADILLIDHHEFYNDVNSKRTTLVKPCMLEPGNSGSQYCASKMVFDIFSEITEMKEFKWIAALGIITDNNSETFKKTINEVLKEYGLKPKKNVFSTELGIAASVLASADATNPPKLQQAFEILYTARNIYDIIDSPLKRIHEKVQEEVKFFFENYKKFSEDYPELDLMFVEVNSRFRIKSPVVNKISIEKFPSKIILVYSDPNLKGEIKISARNQSAEKSKNAIKVSDLLEKAVKGLDGAIAGGHAPAAGASIKREDWDVFKKRIVEYVKKKRSKNA